MASINKLNCVLIAITSILISGHVIEATQKSLYFKRQPDSEYFFDSTQKSLVLDCTTGPIQTNRINWIKDNKGDALGYVSMQRYDTDFKREILQNGSLKLEFLNEYSNLYNANHELTRASSSNESITLLAIFRCIASDSFGTIISNPARVYRFNDVNGTGKLLKRFKQPVNKTLVEGERLILRCKPVFNFKAIRTRIRHKWLKDDERIDYGKNKILYKDGTLEITSTNSSDSGVYKCIARYRNYAFESRQAHIKINKKSLVKTKQSGVLNIEPRFASYPTDTQVKINDEIILECKALDEGSLMSQNYTYKWLKNGGKINFGMHHRIELVQGNSLRIESVETEDSGTYTCRICSIMDERELECDERSGLLQVLEPPTFIKRPVNMNATQSSDIEFECSAAGIPYPTIQWFKNGEPIYPSEYFQFDAKQGNLKIRGIISQDEGYYQCLATNDLGTVQSIARLSVDAGKILAEEMQDSSEDFNHKKLKKSTFLTTAAAPTKPTSVIHLSAPLSLKSFEKKPKSIRIEWQPPSIIKEIPPMSGQIKKELSYIVAWRAKNIERQIEQVTTDTSFDIIDLSPDTLYLIQVCAIVNTTKGPYSFLEVRTSSEPKIPSKPVDFKAQFVDFKYHKAMTPTLKFKWKRPVSNANDIIKYRLYYEHLHYGGKTPSTLDERQYQEDEMYSNADYMGFYDYNEMKSEEKFLDIETPVESFEYNPAGSSYEFLLEDLKKYSTYNFRLVAINKLMESLNGTESFTEKGAKLTIETPSDVPDGPPENLNVEILNTTAILISWKIPDLSKCNGLIIGYKLTVKENDQQVWNSNEESEPRNKLITNLLPNHKYSIRVTASTVNGSGPASEWVIAETFAFERDETKVPGQPLELFTEPTDKSIVIHWVPPIDSNITLVRKYLLSYGVNYPSHNVELPGNQNSYIIKDLEPSSTYILSLKAKNNMGTSKEILKDVVTKRKSALGENEKLFPPLNVQAVAISPHSVEVRWTDWHLKQDETIPDDRFYTIQYNTAEMSLEEYQYLNSTERNMIVTNLKPSTLYDFSVKLVIGARKSDWSMTTSQMTMESSPAPRDIRIKSDPENPTNVVIRWLAPNYSLITGYVISFVDVDTYSREKENTSVNIKWQHNYITANDQEESFEAVVRKLKTNTVYYFKIQARNNRAYGGSSPTIIYRTPNQNGIGGGIVYTPNKQSKEASSNSESNREAINTNTSKNKIQKYIFLLIITIGSSLLILIVIILIVFCCKKKSSKKQNYTDASLLKRNYNMDSQSIHAHQQQQQLLMCNNINSNGNGFQVDQSMPPAISQGNNHINFSINSSTTSTLLKQQAHRTPNHHATPNHMMLMMNPLSISNTNHVNSTQVNTHLSNPNTSQNEVELYSNMTNQHQNPENPNSYVGENCFQFNNSYNKQHFSNNQRTSSINEDNMSHHDDLNKDLTSASEALAAANAAFNAPIAAHHLANNNPGNDNFIMRNGTRPKPIAMPINTDTASPNSMNPMMANNDQHFINSTASTRKSFKNLPMATATLIQSNPSGSHNNPNHPLSFNFNDVSKQQSQKIHYTARPYIIDNQVQSNGDHSNHSPASSCHSSSQQSQVYDKVAGNNAVSTKSLLQPLKSFGSSNPNSNQIASIQPSSFSIPNTPAKYCENLNNNMCNVARSPGKKQLLVSLGQQSTTTSTSVLKGNSQHAVNGNKSSEVLMMMGKSIENLYEKKLTSVSNNGEELNAEMANLEGIMKDLDAITAQQFEC